MYGVNSWGSTNPKGRHDFYLQFWMNSSEFTGLLTCGSLVANERGK
jgi:hypothetical protein